MNERIKKLRNQSLNAVNRISAERAELITRFYASREAQSVSVPMQRALAFRYILANKQICINDGELIVGERGPAPKATPTYPEICLHSLTDLETLDRREKVSFKVDAAAKQIYEKTIIPFWKDRTQRDHIFSAMDKAWHYAYEAGVFTEFQEQRAPGHTVCGGKIYFKGFRDLIREIRLNLKQLDFLQDPAAFEKAEQLRAMEVAAEALIMYAERHASLLETMADSVQDDKRRHELEQTAAICRQVPAYAPRNFHQALQYYWFVHLGVITAKESSTYTDFCLINLGGLKTDGSDGVNELTYLILEVIEEMRLLQPSSMIQVSKKNPDAFVRRAVKIIKTGFGQPSVFNTDAIIQELVRQGKDLEDARNGGASGCVEAGAFGTESYILTGYFNLVKVFEITLHNGLDPRTGKGIGLKTGDPENFGSFPELLGAFEKQLHHFIDIKIKGNNIIDRLYATRMPVPFLSLLIDDCIDNGVDYNAGGARYNTSYIQGVGLGSLTDILTAIEYHVYDQRDVSLAEMMAALDADFDRSESLRHQLLNKTPKYGNDDDRADRNAVRIFDLFYNAVNGRPTTKKGKFRINLLPTTSHVYFGSVIGATPDGRKSGEPLSEGISPVQGMDRNGPTAALKSASKIDHLRTGGTLLNQKFTPSFFETEESITKLVQLIRGYFSLDGHHIQFNVVTADMLRDAQKHPEKYRDLIVRVAGYSDYICDLSKELQDEIIARTAHACF